MSTQEEIRIGVFPCRCGVNIAGVIDMEALTEYCRTLPNVVLADQNIALCTTSGADFIRKYIEENNLNRIIIAACTPKTHEPVFQAVLQDCGLDPSYLEFVNIREHSSFVHQQEPERALEVAKEQIRSGVRRAAELEPVPERIVPVSDAVLVLGGGVAGLQSALDLSNQGHKVYLVEENPTIGGAMAKLDRTFPTDDCSIWILGPVMLETQRDKNIELFTLAEVTNIDGYVGNFEIEITQHPRYTKSACNGCGSCFEVCPAVGPSDFDRGLGPRPAIYTAFSQAVPMVAQIDMDHCIKCGNCQTTCELNAIDFDQKEKKISVKVGGIIIATGWDEYEPDLGYLGYGKYENVITQLTFERMLAPNGPTVGHVVRPSDGKEPENVLFIQCVGSRDINRNVYCSSGVCCMVSIKNSKLVKSHYPDMEVTVAYIDIRAAGKGYEEYYADARRSGVKFIRSKVGRVREDPKTKQLKVVLEDTLSPDNTIREYFFDLVILSAAMMPSKSFDRLNKVLNLSKHPSGFLKEYHQRLNTVDTDVPGIVLSGACHGPKAISESIMQAKGAASSIGKLLTTGEFRIKLIRAVADEEKCAKCGMCAAVCPFNAIEIDPVHGAQVDDILCRGCGLCASVCPSEAITVRYYRTIQYNEQIDGILEDALVEP